MKLKESQQQSNRLSNEDLVPLGQEKRTWKAMNFASIWMGCIHNIPTYATVGGLIAIGLSLGRCWRSLLRHHLSYLALLP